MSRTLHRCARPTAIASVSAEISVLAAERIWIALSLSAFVLLSFGGQVAPRNDVPRRCREANRFRVAVVIPPKTEGAGKAGCVERTRSLMRKTKAHEFSHHRFAEAIRLSLRGGFNGFLRARPRDRALLSPSPAQCVSIVASLISASGYQAHTTSPSASTRFVKRSAETSIASRVNVRDDRDTPLMWARDGARS